MMKDIKARYYMVERSMQPKAIIFNGKLPIYLVDPMMNAQSRRKDQNNDNLTNGSVQTILAKDKPWLSPHFSLTILKYRFPFSSYFLPRY